MKKEDVKKFVSEHTDVIVVSACSIVIAVGYLYCLHKTSSPVKNPFNGYNSLQFGTYPSANRIACRLVGDGIVSEHVDFGPEASKTLAKTIIACTNEITDKADALKDIGIDRVVAAVTYTDGSFGLVDDIDAIAKALSK